MWLYCISSQQASKQSTSLSINVSLKKQQKHICILTNTAAFRFCLLYIFFSSGLYPFSVCHYYCYCQLEQVAISLQNKRETFLCPTLMTRFLLNAGVRFCGSTILAASFTSVMTRFSSVRNLLHQEASKQNAWKLIKWFQRKKLLRRKMKCSKCYHGMELKRRRNCVDQYAW